ncbi:MAG: alpha/beta hydrolase [Acidimicrobiales bacterium]
MADVVRHRAGEVDLEVLEAGAGGRPLLLVHGFTGAKEDFGDWIDAFAAEGWWVVAPDLRGHGGSDQPVGEDAYSFRTFADDLLALADGLGWARFCLLGHSMGGMVAQELVLGDPQRVERLVLMDTCHGPVEGVDPDTVAVGVEIIRAQGLGALVELLAALPQAERAPSDAALRASRPGYSAFADGKVHRCSGDMYAAMAQAFASRPDRLAELASLAVPVQVVVGDEDQGFLGPSRRMAEAIDGARLAVIRAAAHSPQFESPEQWWEAVSSFLGAELPTTPAAP